MRAPLAYRSGDAPDMRDVLGTLMLGSMMARVEARLLGERPLPQPFRHHDRESGGPAEFRACECLDAKKLDIALDTPLLEIARVADTFDGHPVKLRRSLPNTGRRAFVDVTGDSTT